MSQILELREKRAMAWDRAKSFLDSSRDENGLISQENAAIYDRMEAEIVAQGEQINRLERQAALDAEMNRPTSSPIVNTPQRPDAETKPGRMSAEYKSAFWNMMRAQKPNFDVSNALHIGTQEGGGYLAPDEYERTLVEALTQENMLRKLCHIIQTGSGDRKIPIVATKGAASWVEEAGAIPESDDTFGQISIGAHKLATLIKVSEELLQDNVFNLEAYIAKEFARRIAAKEEESFILGDGTGKPTGLLAATGGAQIGGTTTGASITLDDVIDLYYSLGAPYRSKAVFIMNDATVKLIRKLKDSTGAYLWQPSIKEATPDTILNRPLYTCSFMPTVAAGAKAILFGDLSYFWICDRQGRVFKRLNELYATTNQVGFLVTQRVDAKLVLPEAVKILKIAG
jgi:HK97 family phage major capsid protein